MNSPEVIDQYRPEWSITSGVFDPAAIDLETAAKEVERVEWAGSIHQNTNELLANRLRAAQLVNLAVALTNSELLADPQAERAVQNQVSAAAMRLFTEWQQDYAAKAETARSVNPPAAQAINYLAEQLGEEQLPESTHQYGLALIGFLHSPDA